MSLNEQIPSRLYFRIRDVAKIANVEPHVLRYWETEFPIISPQKSPAGHRVYRRSDVESILLVKHLLYVERLTIEGARRRLSDLRREGELKKTRDQFIQQSPVSSSPNLPGQFAAHTKKEKLMRLRELSEELKALIDEPVNSILKKSS